MKERPTFADVAAKIANPPPEWLPIALEHFSDRLTEEPGDVKWAIEKMAKAIDDLLWLLPAFEIMGAGLAGERKDIRVMLALLPGIKRDIERVMQESKGRKPLMGRAICAAVMLEAWELARGSVQPHSGDFRQACDAYWQACGGKSIGDRDNWRPFIQKAVKEDYLRGVFKELFAVIV
jgi:hypothetical protein